MQVYLNVMFDYKRKLHEHINICNRECLFIPIHTNNVVLIFHSIIFGKLLISIEKNCVNSCYVFAQHFWFDHTEIVSIVQKVQ